MVTNAVDAIVENKVLDKKSEPAAKPLTKPKLLRIAGDSVRFFISQVVDQMTGIVKGLIVPNVLGPAQYGVLASLNLIEHYARYANLGIHTNNLFKLPAQRAQNQLDEAEETKNSVFSVSLLMGSLATLTLLGVALVGWNRFPQGMRLPLLVASFIPLAVNLRSVFMTLVRADKHFAVLSQVSIWSSVGDMGLGILLAIWLKVFGVLMAQLLVGGAVLWWIQKRCHYSFRLYLKWQSIWTLLKFSIPVLFIIGLLHAWLVTIDRIMVIKYFGTLGIGYYTIASLMSMPVTLIPTALGTVMSTDVIEACAQDPHKARHQITQSTYLVAFVSALVAGAISLLSPLAIRYLFPKYAPAIAAARWLPMAMYFESIGMFGYYVAISTGRTRSYTITMLGYAACAYLIFDLGLRHGDLATAAWLMAGISALKAFLLLGFTVWPTFPNRTQAASFIRDILLLGAFLSGSCMFLHTTWPVGIEGPAVVALRDTFLKVSCYVVSWGLIVWWLRERLEWPRMRQLVLQEWRKRQGRAVV